MQYVRRQNAALKSDGFGIFLAGFFRFILHRNLKVALVLGVVCIGVKGFFFCLLFLLLLHKGVNAAASNQTDQRQYAKDYYLANGLGSGSEQSGILFLLAVGSRKYVTITYGEGVTAFTDYRIEQQEDEIVPELSDEEWADAAYTYIDMCDDALDHYADYGEPIDVDNDIGLEDLLIAMIFPLGISAFICLILYHQMKTARKKTEADEYMPGFTLRVKRDRYTHTTRERTYDPPQKESNSSGGSSVDSDGFGGSSGGSF